MDLLLALASQAAAPATSLGVRATQTVQPVAAPSIGGTVLALLLVLGLILAMAWLLRRMPGNRFAGNAALRPVASLALGARERLMVVEVGGEQLLLGITASSIQLLHKLETPLTGDSATSGFADLLARRLRGRERAA